MTERTHAEVGYDSALEAIRRRRRRARVASRLLFPTMLLSVWLANDYSAWWMLPGAATLAVLQALGLVGYLQVCPRCRGSLTENRRFVRVLAPTCPTCGLPID